MLHDSKSFFSGSIFSFAFLYFGSSAHKSCEKISHVANICQHSQSGYQAKACEQKWIKRVNEERQDFKKGGL